MNQLPMLREAWAMLKRNPVLWSVALIGLSLDFSASWFFIVAPPEASVLRTLLAFVLAAFTTGALISMVNVIADGQTTNLAAGLQAGLRRWVPLLALSLVLYLPVWLLIFFLSGSILTIFTSGLGQPGGLQATEVLAALPSFLNVAGAVLVVNVYMSLVGVGAERALVIDHLPLIDAVKFGWRLLLSHWRDYLSIGVMLIGIVLGLGLIFSVVLGSLLNTLAASLSPTGDAAAAAANVSSPVNVIFFLASLVVNSLYTVFATSLWTLMYREWQSQVIQPVVRDQDQF
jgi:hypothetical protein